VRTAFDPTGTKIRRFAKEEKTSLRLSVFTLYALTVGIHPLIS
jgi:hypothetical protein